MRRATRSRGEGAFGLIVGLAIFIIGGMALWKIVPLHFHGNVILDTMSENANFGNMRSPDKMKDAIMSKAAEVGVSLPKTDIVIERRENIIKISAKYNQVTEVFGMKYTYKFDNTIEKPVF